MTIIDKREGGGLKMDFMQTFLLYVGMFAGLVIFTLMLVNFLQGGYLFPALRVKTSGGRRILVRLRSLTTEHFKVGRVQDTTLIFKGLDKEIKRLTISNDYIFRGGGVYYVVVDAEKYAVVKRFDFSTVTGWDPTKWNNLLTRALTKPQILDTRAQLMLLGLVIVIIGLVVVGLMVKSNGDKITALSLAYQAAQTVATQAATVGAV